MAQPYRIHTDKSWATTLSELRREFERWRVKDWHLEGPPNVAGSKHMDPGAARRVTLTFTPPGAEAPLVWVKDTQDRAVDNLRVIFLIIESLRLNDLRGMRDDMREAYLALPPATEETKAAQAVREETDPYKIIGAPKDWPLGDIEDLYQMKAKRYHPDAPGGGDAALMSRLNVAMDAVRADKKAR